MPLDALLPVIDDRRFDDILAEARTRIPRYTSEWTDLNDNEPGMALVQLLAWMTDMLLYRLGKVPQQNYLKFLELIGIQLQPAEPASTEVTFPVSSSFTGDYVIVPSGTQVSAEGQPPIVFETARALIALRAALVAVITYDGYAFLDVTSDSEQADQPFAPFGPLAVAGSALMLGFDAAQPLPQVDLDLAFFVSGKELAPTSSNCSLAEARLFPPVRITWEFWNGSEWLALRLLKDETNAFLRSGHVHLRLPAQGQLAAASFAGSASLLWIRARLAKPGYERPPKLDAVRTNTTAVRQVQTVRDEVLGGSDGQPHQSFVLENGPVVAGTLQLDVDPGDGFEGWTEVADFFSSAADAKVFRLDRTTGTVLFGDGEHGAIPPINVSSGTTSIVARRYQYGGGTVGNVGAGALKTLLASIEGIDDNAVANLRAATGGSNEESLEHAKQRAPAQLKSRCRAVTADDFAFLARQAGPIARAHALPRAHPSFPGIEIPGAVTVVIVPDGDAPDPTPSEGTIRSVCAYLSERKLITTELFVVRPTYAEVCVTADIVVDNEADLAAVQDNVDASLTTYFHPLRGGANGDGWPFGGDIYYSRVLQRILEVAGVARVESATITLDGVESEPCADVAVPAGALTFSTGHAIRVRYDFEAA
jgi:predicted phage baseplate assembly protein